MRCMVDYRELDRMVYLIPGVSAIPLVHGDKHYYVYTTDGTEANITEESSFMSQNQGGPEGTSLHKFFIALHKFWLVWKKN